MEKKKEKKPLEKHEIIRKASEIIPFFMVSIAFFVNLFSGLTLGVDILTIMIRSIIAVVIFSLIGFFLGKTLKSIAETIEKDGVSGDNAKSTVEFSSEPDDSDLLKEMRMKEDGFEEANPAEFTGNTK